MRVLTTTESNILLQLISYRNTKKQLKDDNIGNAFVSLGSFEEDYEEYSTLKQLGFSFYYNERDELFSLNYTTENIKLLYSFFSQLNIEICKIDIDYLHKTNIKQIKALEIYIEEPLYKTIYDICTEEFGLTLDNLNRSYFSLNKHSIKRLFRKKDINIFSFFKELNIDVFVEKENCYIPFSDRNIDNLNLVISSKINHRLEEMSIPKKVKVISYSLIYNKPDNYPDRIKLINKIHFSLENR